MLSLGGIFGKRGRERERRFDRDRRFAPGEGRGNRSCQAIALELVAARQQPNVVDVLHAAIGATKRDHRLKFFGDDRFTRIGAQKRRWQIKKHRQFELGDPGLDGVAEADVDHDAGEHRRPCRSEMHAVRSSQRDRLPRDIGTGRHELSRDVA